MTGKKFVEIGRVALVSFGADEGKLCAIVDVLDQKRVLVDGPVSLTGMPRQVLPLRWLALTDFKVKIGPGCRAHTLRKAFLEDEILDKWGKTTWGQKKENAKKRRETGDFDRFRVMVARKERAAAVNEEFNKLKKASKK